MHHYQRGPRTSEALEHLPEPVNTLRVGLGQFRQLSRRPSSTPALLWYTYQSAGPRAKPATPTWFVYGSVPQLHSSAKRATASRLSNVRLFDDLQEAMLL
jgi:hypothetical protein